MTRERMEGRKIVVVGGGTGIGRATAIRCAQEGAAVAVIGRRPEPLEEVAALTQGFAAAADARSEAGIRAAIDRAAQHMGGIDGLVNAVGVLATTPLDDLGLDEWEDSLRSNLTAPYLVCRAALPHLRAAGSAAIVNVAALAAIRPGVSSAAYSAAKAGLVQFSKVIGAQLAPAIRVNSVCPGVVDTPMTSAYLNDKSESEAAAFLGRYSTGRMSDPVEIANVILFLLSDEASSMIGCNYIADAGRAFQ
ncbi:SDR family NAD(P)-dependent oxidoreductase [Sphingomonas sp. 35-24ZXX]|uniref:SDR family NAD(P)-dependent oxidoreductase n=1 Tax=Sphingomonas sp. 35-24ZXX TaxID=1545915 RepID=UPI00053BFABB|nr:SDR family oxidoreductase [Sphingomonas sp. 35-24ZXX]